MQTNEQLLKDIASQLELGLRVFVHRETLEVIAVPKEEDLDLGDPDHWEADLERLKAAPDDFVLFEPMDSTEAFAIMEEFAESVKDAGFRTQLKNALSQTKPFARFKAIVDASGAYRDRWFEFRKQAEHRRLQEKWETSLL